MPFQLTLHSMLSCRIASTTVVNWMVAGEVTQNGPNFWVDHCEEMSTGGTWEWWRTSLLFIGVVLLLSLWYISLEAPGRWK